ncbi:kinesin [Westerdykella ornata]|uniref:Kinesin-like protein n=1 Tax=Westerdykella ornata TaxID=318751 RepID=A0A6A6JYR0_WESOR|nr:kinesin [Westerdykella ornata]KAF2281547.1 kinesin [Westerdykella ornata]
MEPPPRPSSSLFDVYLRLRPSTHSANPRFLNVEETDAPHPTHITIKPPTNDNRKRAVERFAFTRVFEEDAEQMDLFKGTGALSMIEGVLGGHGRHGRDGLLATLGVTGSGKSHTILGTKTVRGITQMSLDVLFQATGNRLVQSFYGAPAFSSLAAADVSEANMFTATAYLDAMYGDNQSERCPSRAQTSMLECSSFLTNPSSRSKNIPRLSAMPQSPAIEDIELPSDPTAEYAIVISMYEVYNDRIFDLLAGNVSKSKHPNVKRRALLFKNTEQSPDRKVVAGLTKIICGSLEEALMVLETGLMERKVAGTGSNAVSSRSHGFFCIEVKKRNAERKGPWSTSTLSIVDLAGSERARNAKTAGATLAEAGKINESLMYLGQCMQMQSDNQDGSRNIVPFRQCKLTELLFSNSFPSTTARQTTHHHQPQKSIMIVTADPKGDFNATSQILRYSALAREVTVPRIPSTTSTILAGTRPKSSASSHMPGGSGRSTPSAILEELDSANSTISRLTSEIEILALRLAEETARRKAVEQSWQAAEMRMQDLEQEIRDECFAAMEEAVEAERRRWRCAWEVEAENQEGRLDAKIDVVIQAARAEERERLRKLERGFDGSSSSGRKEGKGWWADDEEGREVRLRVRELEEENRGLRMKVERGEREKVAKSASPVKVRRVLKANASAKRWVDPERMEGLDSDY